MLGDLVLVNGHVLTMDRDQPSASGVAIRSGKIAAVGDDVAVRAAAAPGSEEIDINGRTATPGLYDAHSHPGLVGQALSDLNLASPPNRSIADIQALVAEAASNQIPDTWIVGRGYDQARLDDQRHPTREDLDAVAPDHPVILIRACHHIAAANSRALAIAGISRDTPDPDGGTIDRDAGGEPTGVVREAAEEMVRTAKAPLTVDEMKAALVRGGNAFLASGVTSTAEAGVGDPVQFQAYQQLWASGALPIRTYLMMMMDETLDPLIQLGVTSGFGDDWLQIGLVKLFSDGSIGGRTSRMHQPFEGEAENVGLWMMPPEELKAKVLRAHKAGFQVGIHAIGDAAIDLVLDAYEEAMETFPRPEPRHRIEHCSIIDERILDRIAKLGVIPIPGTSFLYHFLAAYSENLGMDRLRYAYAMSSFKERGIVAAASTDAPVVPTSATIGLQMMMTRKDMSGKSVWPDENIGLDDALRAYTVNSAYASFQEDRKGTLKTGMLGDVTVFETNLQAVEAENMGEVEIDYTIIDGRVVFSRDSA